MSRYDGLIIPRSYSEYLNKTDSATLSQMLQHLTGLWSHAVSAGDQKPVTSDAVNVALANLSELKQLYDYSHRPSSPNIIPTSNKLSYMLATSSMTENKPIAEGYIINLNWDNAGILTQLFVPSSTGEGRIGIRTRNERGQWSDWQYYIKGSDVFYDYNNFTLIKENTTPNFTESGEFTATKNAIVNISNLGSNESTSEIAWGRVIVGNITLGGYSTTIIGMGTTLFIKAGTTFTYDLYNNDKVRLKISYQYVE